MKRARRRYEAKAALELIEEATHLLRSASRPVLALYYLGTVPFVLGLLFFWTEMSRSASAYQHLAGGALSVAFLFAVMKTAHALFARSLRASLTGTTPSRLGAAGLVKIAAAQTALQGTGLFILALAAAVTLPVGWVYAFYQHATCQDDAGAAETTATIRRSLRQAALWPGQNHALLSVVAGFGLCVFINWTAVCYLLPRLAHTLFGVESVFTRSGMSLFNSTFFAVVAGLTYLSIDPLVKAVYVLRTFYAESIGSGEDLRCELNQAKAEPGNTPGATFGGTPTRTRGTSPLAAKAAWLALLLCLCLQTQAPARNTADPSTGNSPAASPARVVSPAELDQAISDVIQGRKYTWRLPRDTQIEKAPEKNFLSRFFEAAGKWMQKAAKRIGDWLDRLLRNLFKSGRPRFAPTSGYGWIIMQEILLYGLILAAALGLGYLIFKTLRERRFNKVIEQAEPLRSVPEIADESVGADQLPEDGWTQLARELVGKGELRLAMRALYFASLSHLAGRQLISLAKYKSNLDYHRELQRRGHAEPRVLALFGENVSVFDRTWYGMHEVNADALTQFSANVDRIRSSA